MGQSVGRADAAGVATSVVILRESGPMDIRDLTAATAKRMGWSIMYADVDVVMTRAEVDGLVRPLTDPQDYRERVWEAVNG